MKAEKVINYRQIAKKVGRVERYTEYYLVVVRYEAFKAIHHIQ